MKENNVIFSILTIIGVVLILVTGSSHGQEYEGMKFLTIVYFVAMFVLVKYYLIAKFLGTVLGGVYRWSKKQ